MAVHSRHVGAFVVVLVGVVGTAIALFEWLLRQPVRGWVYAASLAFNAVVLIPLWAICWLVANDEPEVWARADGYAYGFSIAFVLPRVLFYLLWQRTLRERK